MTEAKQLEKDILKFGACRCVICGEKVTAPPFITSKPHRGPVMYAHTECFEAEQREAEGVDR